MPPSYARAARDIVLICVRSVASLSNAIIFVVLGLLFALGERQTALFLSAAIVAGVLIGVINDIRARLALERLQLLTTPTFTRMGARGESERVYAEVLEVGDTVKLVLGDQVPCDATLLEASNFEISQALLTGESDSFARRAGERVRAGDLVVAGSALVRIDTRFADSELSKMTSAIKRYELTLSPIQQAIHATIRYSGWGILALIVLVYLRGLVVHEPFAEVIKNIAALTSTLVPQGLLVVTAILFAYGAIRLYQDHVLLQDINATEKLGRLEYLCIDKTGTLTETTPTVKRMVAYESTPERAKLLMAAYIRGSGDQSQTIAAIGRSVGASESADILNARPFTSERQWGAVSVRFGSEALRLLVGGPDVLLPSMAGEAHAWLAKRLTAAQGEGNRLVCLASARGLRCPSSLEGLELSPIAVFELESRLREGTQEIIHFLQERGVSIRVISGDNPETVSAVVASAGITNPRASIIGSELEQLAGPAFEEAVSRHTVFARVRPELKERIVQALKRRGFTAMVGDGANDALAIKAADLGVAMWSGASATRQLAAVVLTDDSFAALPRGIALADTIISNIEIISSLYFFEIGLGAVLFIGATLLGYPYPLSPQNVVLINYFTVGFPGVLTFAWVMRGVGERREVHAPFLSKLLPFALWSALLAGGCLVLLLALVPLSGTRSTPLLIAFSLSSLVFFLFAPGVYGARVMDEQYRGLALFALFEVFALVGLFLAPWALIFFDIAPLRLSALGWVALCLALYATLQFLLARRYTQKNLTATWPL